ncbi:hypothetical protein [Nannocystis pusilla]|uniref:hypothetical protein n=1 Tax=Nannocystis pusilla TaxID=889268 RepID=UPI003DA62995
MRLSRLGEPGRPGVRPPPARTAGQAGLSKWAELRFDITDYDETFETFLVEIAAQSATICGVCGGAGYHHCIDGWEETICDRCRARAETRIDGPPGSNDNFER